MTGVAASTKTVVRGILRLNVVVTTVVKGVSSVEMVLVSVRKVGVGRVIVSTTVVDSVLRGVGALLNEVVVVLQRGASASHEQNAEGRSERGSEQLTS